MGQRDEDEHGLRENLVPLMFRHVLDGAAVVQAVRQFDEHHTDIVIERKENALEVFRLHALLADIRAVGLLLVVQHRLDLGEAIDQRGNLAAETLAEVLYGVIRVFHYVMQEGGRDGFVAQADIVHDNLRNGDGMQHVRLSAAAAHIAVGLIRKLEGTLHHFQFRRIGAAFFRRCPQMGIGLVDNLVIFFGELRKTHIVNLLIY